MIGAARIVTSRDGRYRPDPDGELAIILAVSAFQLEVVDVDLNEAEVYATTDIVAWFPEKPGRWWMRLGTEPVLGARDLRIAADMGGTIRLHPTPLTWAEAGGRGVCVLQWGSHLRPLFEGVERIDYSDPRLKYKVTRMLRSWEPEVRHAA